MAGGGGGAEAVVLRAGYSAVAPGTWIRPHYGETNAQLKLHFGLSVPVNSSGQACAQLRVGERSGDASPSSAASSSEAASGAASEAGEWRGWSEGGVLLFDDSFIHEVRSADGGLGGEGGGGCGATRVVLQLVLQHPDV